MSNNTKDKAKQPFIPYKKKNTSNPSQSPNQRDGETVKTGRALAAGPVLYPTKGTNVTNVINWINALLPYIGNATSPRIQGYLKKKEFIEAIQIVKSKEQEREMSKTEIAILIDENKENRLNNQNDKEHLKVAFNMLLGNISKSSIDLLKSHYLEKQPPVPWDDVLQQQDSISLVQAIDDTHLAPTSGVTALRAAEHVRMLFSLSAHQNETISDFRQNDSTHRQQIYLRPFG
jgi:hypothetical protein